MVQLSLLGAEAPTLSSHLEQIASRWLRRGALGAHVDDAVRVTAAHFGAWSAGELVEAQRERVAAYFGGVMRRRLMHGVDAQSVAARRRLIAASVETDLRAAGWRAESAAAEARRVAGLPSNASGAA